MPVVNILARRTFTGRIVWAVAMLSTLARATRTYSEETTKEIPFRWRVPVAQYGIVKSNLKFIGKIETEHDTKGLPLILIFIGISLVPSLADAILVLRQKLIQPGLKIDARGNEIKIDVDPDLPRATILLIDKSGAKIYEADQLSTPTELIKILANAMTK
jgi:hypothetical protein